LRFYFATPDQVGATDMLALGSGTRHADARPLANLLGFNFRQ
jgi:hypothetical protein